MNSNADCWERFLDPDVVRPSLFLATMFITTFEILKNCVVDRLRSFYTNGWDEQGAIVGPEYEEKVLSRHKNALYASLAWLRENNVVSEEDLQTFERLKAVRNRLAHELFEVVTGQVESQHDTEFSVLVELLRKIEAWWVVNLEIPTNPDFDGQEIDEDGIVPGAILSLQMLIQVSSGNTELLEHWRKVKKSQSTRG